MASAAHKAKSARQPKFMTRRVRRCFTCGRFRSYMRDFDLCRICFRKLANNGQLPGVRKSSW